MLKKLGLGSIFQWFILAVVVLAIWKGTNGDIGLVVDWVVNAVNVGADILLNLWNKFVA